MTTPRKWRTKDGKRIDVCDMSTEHIRAALAMLERKNYIGVRELAAELNAPPPRGEYAFEAFLHDVDEIASRPVSPFIDHFRDELKRRGITS